MTPEVLQRLSRLLDIALECGPAQRESWLAGLEGDEAVLVPRLRELLALRDAGTGFERLDAGPAFSAAASTAGAGAPKPGLAAGQRVGPYRLLRELGAGGMGEVWLAERADGLLKRQVALKLPMLGLRREVLVQRFARERDILATLEHPHIARLYDAGLSDDGQPYLALEYVEGTPIDAWCRDQAAPVEQRVRLLLQVADAVAYAHRRLVLHRDLKPSNILVNGAAEVRLLDFGVAKLMESSGAAESTELTEAFGRALTLRYASPEQLRGETLTTASDVFSLGVVAFELLAGTPPFAVERATPAALALRLAAEEAPRASTRAADPSLRQRLRGDLDAILGRALKSRPEERYPTVEALAEDLQRHLAGERVAARPDSLGYHARRAALRYRWPLGAAGVALAALGLALGAGATALVIGALLVGLGAALWQARRAQEQARRAHTEARTAQEVQTFLEGIFSANSGEQPDPVAARQRSAKDLLDEGAARVARQLDDAPAAKLRIVRLLAGLYNTMALADRQIELRRLALEVSRQSFAGDPALRATVLAELAEALHGNGLETEGDARLAEAEALLKSAPGVDLSTRIAVRQATVARAHRRLDPAALDDARELVAWMRRQPPQVRLLEAMQALGAIERQAGQYRESARTFAEILDLLPSIPGAQPHWPSSTYSELARSQARLGLMQDSENNERRAITLAEASSGPSSVYVLALRLNLANFLSNRGRLREAIAAADEVLAHLAEIADELGRARIEQAARRIVAQAQARLGDLEAALDMLAPLADTPKAGQDAPIQLITVALVRARAVLDLGRAEECEACLDAVASMVQEKQIRDPTSITRLSSLRIRLALARGRADLARSAWESRRELGEPIEGDLSEDAAAVLLACGDDDAALAAAERGLREGTFDSGEIRPLQHADLLLVRSAAQRRLGDPAAALASAEKALRLIESWADASLSPDRVQALGQIALAHLAMGAMGEARRCVDEAAAVRARHHALGHHITRAVDEAAEALRAAGT